MDPHARCHWPLSINEEKYYLIPATRERVAKVLKRLQPPARSYYPWVAFQVAEFLEELKESLPAGCLGTSRITTPST
ncbi:MAG: hypothetical protein ABSE93_30170 [Terriglobia bacterium]